MREHQLKILAPGILLAATAFALAVAVGAQTPPPSASPMAAKTHQVGPMAEQPKDADMKAECQAMMTRKQEMQGKLEAMDVVMDKLVAEMNAAKTSKQTDAMEKPMAAVLNELVAQRKAARAMMMEMQSETMEHMMRHMHGRGGKGAMGTMGAMECPMMKMGADSAAQAGKR